MLSLPCHLAREPGVALEQRRETLADCVIRETTIITHKSESPSDILTSEQDIVTSGYAHGMSIQPGVI
jgi:hypothetical protein